ncbi:hypothetical protein [Nocardia sp. NPDC005998]|uniref:hypothetical protein n=1 Tax=Nocardia sp. NPDC005998 TaxID=3156894 RepID=UPI0033AF69E2
MAADRTSSCGIELVALAARDARARERLRELWTQWWLPDRQHQLCAEYSAAPPERVAQAWRA